MNQSHVIDSWIAELALGARSRRPRPAMPVAAAGVGSELARVAAKPGPARFMAVRDRQRPARGPLRPCLSAA